MAENLPVEQPITLDLLDTSAPALSSTSDVPIVETKPDATPAPADEKAEAVPPEESGEAEPEPAESATADTDEQSGPPRKDGVPKGVGKRLAELTKRAEAAEARLDRALAALERAAGGQPQAEPVQSAQPVAEVAEPVRPQRSDYGDPDAYDQAMLDYAEQRASWIAERAIATREAQEQQRSHEQAVEQARRATQEAYAARMDKVKAKYTDFAEVAESPDVQVSVPMAAAILHSENGPELQYYLGKNPAEAERIRQLSPPLQLIELGKIEARLTAAPPPPPKKSQAPAPIRPLAGETTPSVKDPESMTMEEYAAYRRAQMTPPRQGARRY